MKVAYYLSSGHTTSYMA